MGITEGLDFVPKLDATGSNFFQWNTAIQVYTSLHDSTDVLDGIKTIPAGPDYLGLIADLPPLDVTVLDLA
jgi:hypothetical protein